MANKQVEVKKSTEAAKSGRTDVWTALRNEVDHLFDRFSPGFGRFSFFPSADTGVFAPFFSSTGTLAPSMDVIEDGSAYTITAELPGLEDKDVDVSVDGSILNIKGEKQQETERKEKNYYLSERSYGAFARSLYLPDGVDRDKISAHIAKGVLTVTLPKTPAAQSNSKKIEVKAG
ncbi:molecular chaperone Hsp20 [Acidocella aquatica]|uniref:Molecular chaperone Hsp20 n=2 Tax=Acidocella aquatica TaxID=1922313 RepID=A0ABQ6A7G0_9PROT|nr:molecular chaperone Hsp20 [Acidocella aquatica]